jgi:hypothetical protein
VRRFDVLHVSVIIRVNICVICRVVFLGRVDRTAFVASRQWRCVD